MNEAVRPLRVRAGLLTAPPFDSTPKCVESLLGFERAREEHLSSWLWRHFDLKRSSAACVCSSFSNVVLRNLAACSEIVCTGLQMAR